MTGEVIFEASEEKDKDVADTSKEAYKKLVENGEIKGQKKQVLRGIAGMMQLPTIDELTHETLAGWEKSTVSGRIGDLKDLGLVQPIGKRKSTYSGIKSKVWALTSKGENVLQEVQDNA